MIFKTSQSEYFKADDFSLLPKKDNNNEKIQIIVEEMRKNTDEYKSSETCNKNYCRTAAELIIIRQCSLFCH